MERVFVIGGGEWQTSLVKKVKELGYEVVNSNLYEDSPAFRFADFCEVADVLDKEANLAIAKKYGIQAVLTDQSDIAVPTVAHVAECLGLPSIGREMAALFTNKYKMCCFCREHGLKVPEFCLCRTPEEAVEFIRRLGRKVIMKPLDSQSSRGVHTLEKPEDVYTYFADSASYSTDRQSVLLERYIEGVEFTVDGIVARGKHHSLAISQKKHFSYNFNIASELFFSYNNSEFDYDKLRKINDHLVELTGLPFGLVHAEYKCENGDFYLIEIAARGGGTRISSHIVPLLTGVDNYSILIEDALGHAPMGLPEGGVSPYARCAVLKFLDVEGNGRRVCEIRGEREIRENPHVVELHLEFHTGDRLFQAKDDRSRIGFYIAYGEDREELLQTMQWVESTLQIRMEEDEEAGNGTDCEPNYKTN